MSRERSKLLKFRIVIASALLALVLAACGGGAPAPAEAPTAAPAAAQPTAAFEPAQDAEPTVGALPTAAPAAEAPTAAPAAAPAAAGSGALAWRDQVLRNDQVLVSITGLQAPPSGQVYAAWLGGASASLPLGKLSLGSDPRNPDLCVAH